MKQKISQKVKKFLPFLIFALSAPFSFSDAYKINSVNYNITGQTRKYSLDTKVKPDRTTVFASEDSLMEYLSDYKKRLENTRAFEIVKVDFSLSDSGKKVLFTQDGVIELPSDITSDITRDEQIAGLEAGENENPEIPETLYLVDLEVTTKDTLHILGAPYPKYDSNNGFSFKLKVKDTNFFGSLEEMGSDFNFAVESDDELNYDYKFGFAINFDTPFKLGIFDAVWKNDHEISYPIGEKTPEWNFKTGLALELPFEKFSVKLDLYQSFIRDLDYEDENVNGTMVHYGDGTYFVENAKLSVPLVIQKINEWGNIYYTPYLEATHNWDSDGISDLNEDLMGPVFTIGQTISTSRINWHGNFRNGLSASMTQSFSYNIQKYSFIPGLNGELKAFKAFKHLGFSADIYAFAYLNGTSTFGERLRGIRDDQYYALSTGHGFQKACETPAAIVLNLDLPVKIFEIRWDEISFIKEKETLRKIMGLFNMEFQISPFLDFALCRNRATGRDFHFADGFYAAGLEAIVYPLRWKGMTVRASVGLDLGQKLPVLKDKLNQEWRDAKSYEISIGIGLHY